VAHALSIETTPRIAAAEPEKLTMMRDLGVARVSVGVQSTNDEVLAEVNRGAQRALADEALAGLMRAGFRRVHVDLVFGLPGQTPAAWREDLLRVVAHGVDSITTYDCLYRGQGRALPHRMAALPTMAEYRALYDAAYELLHVHGYAAEYGSLNFARHAGETGTSPYFEGRLLHGVPYVGLGSYASSLVGDRWWFAPHATGGYIAAIVAGEALPAGDAYALPASERMAKSVLAMLNFGVIDRRSFINQFGCAVDEVFAAAIAFAVEEGWLEDRGSGSRWRAGGSTRCRGSGRCSTRRRRSRGSAGRGGCRCSAGESAARFRGGPGRGRRLLGGREVLAGQGDAHVDVVVVLAGVARLKHARVGAGDQGGVLLALPGVGEEALLEGVVDEQLLDVDAVLQQGLDEGPVAGGVELDLDAAVATDAAGVERDHARGRGELTAVGEEGVEQEVDVAAAGVREVPLARTTLAARQVGDEQGGAGPLLGDAPGGALDQTDEARRAVGEPATRPGLGDLPGVAALGERDRLAEWTGRRGRASPAEHEEDRQEDERAPSHDRGG
jgi:hypothetical protein